METLTIVRISSSELGSCPFCNEVLDGINNFEKAVEHGVKAHHLKLLHAGQETKRDNTGHPWHSTVAILVP